MKDLQRIIDIELDKVTKRLREKNLRLEVKREAKDFIRKNGTNKEYGARPLRRAIEHLVEDPLSEELMKGTFLGKETITADLAVWFRLPSVWVKNPQEFKLAREHEYLRKMVESIADKTFMMREEFEGELKRVLAPEALRQSRDEAIREMSGRVVRLRHQGREAQGAGVARRAHPDEGAGRVHGRHRRSGPAVGVVQGHGARTEGPDAQRPRPGPGAAGAGGVRRSVVHRAGVQGPAVAPAGGLGQAVHSGGDERCPAGAEGRVHLQRRRPVEQGILAASDVKG